jgi:hypothetical protein
VTNTKFSLENLKAGIHLPRHVWEDNIKIQLRETDGQGGD